MITWERTLFPAVSSIWGILTLNTVHRLCIECLREKLLWALHPPLFSAGDEGWTPFGPPEDIGEGGRAEMWYLWSSKEVGNGLLG